MRFGERPGRLVIQANCQGELLLRLLRASPGFDEAWRAELYTNYRRQPVPDESLARCDLFLYQHLGPEWGELSSAALLDKLPRSARAECIPAMFFMHPWPLWCSDPDFDYSDRLLDALLARGLSPAEALHMALRTDIAKLADLDEGPARSLEMEREKEERTSIKYLDFVLANWREEQLFRTINHPRSRVLRLVAEPVLGWLGLPPLPDSAYNAADQALAGLDLPVHPQVAEREKLAWAGRETRFNVYGAPMTYERFAFHYLACKEAGETDFDAWLRVAARRETASQ